MVLGISHTFVKYRHFIIYIFITLSIIILYILHWIESSINKVLVLSYLHISQLVHKSSFIKWKKVILILLINRSQTMFLEKISDWFIYAVVRSFSSSFYRESLPNHSCNWMVQQLSPCLHCDIFTHGWLCCNDSL